jgi:RHS repeat-associated protein
MPSNQENVLCHYHYDPLDRLVGTTTVAEAKLLRFYRKSRLVTEIQGVALRSIFQQDDQLLALHYRHGSVETSLLATDRMRSVLQITQANLPRSIAYSPYGYCLFENRLLSLLGFNGEQADKFTGHYVLGNGYRAFNPVLMRFNSPDSVSPFGKGGLNAYVYCLGDPINRYDENGHFSFLKTIRSVRNFFRKNRHPTSFSAGSKVDGALSNANASSAEMLKNSSPELFKNPHATSPEQYIHHYEMISSINGPRKVPLTTISTFNDLSVLNDSGSVKFVFTDNQNFVVGSDTVHPTLSAFVGRSSVISAGYIRKTGSREYMIDHRSGHYQPSYDSLFPVKELLSNMGAKVSLRHHKDWLNP